MSKDAYCYQCMSPRGVRGCEHGTTADVEEMLAEVSSSAQNLFDELRDLRSEIDEIRTAIRAIRNGGEHNKSSWIPAGEAPPFIQSGMIVRHKDGGPALRVEHIEDLANPTAACRSGVGKAVRVPCADMRADYRLVEPFDGG